MAHIQPLNRDELPQLEQTFKDTESFLGFLPNDVLTMAYLPEATQSFMDFCLSIYKNATLPQDLLHLVGMATSSASGCRYCTAHLANKLSDEGADAQRIGRLWEFRTDPLFTDAERAAIEFAFAAGSAPSAVEPEHYQSLRKHYSEREIVELLFIIGQFGFWNRWNDSVATTLESAPATFSENALPEAHWSLDKHG